MNSARILQPNNTTDNIFNFLVMMISFGLVIQSSLVFWPIENYSTLVYLVFYLPLLILLLQRPKRALKFWERSIPSVFVLTITLLLWVLSTSIWSNGGQGLEPLFGKTLKTILLILLYILGVAILTREAPSTLHRALLFISIISGSMMMLTIIGQLNQGNYFSQYYRLEMIGISSWHSTVNPVVIGIYSGWLTGLASILLLDSIQQKKHLYLRIAIFVSLISFIIIMLLARSRTAFVAIVVFYLSYLIINKNFKIVIGLGFIFLVLLIVGIVSENPVVISTINRGGLTGLRPEIWKAAWLNSLENIWFGAGIWSDTTVIISRVSGVITQMHSHNFYLQLLNWTGLLGLILYFSLLCQSIKLALKQKDSFLGLFALLTLTYFAVVQMFDVYNIFTKPSYYWPCIWLPIGIVVGLSASKSAEDVKATEEANLQKAP